MSKFFTRNKEDFVCEKCGFQVVGDGYTNHCPQCLWSKHVDINPGDRGQVCQGLMKPIGVFGGAASEIEHQCERCGFKKKNKVSKNDNFDNLLAVAKEKAEV